MMAVPPMPEGFTDSTAWRAIHWKFPATAAGELDTISAAVMGWQLANQDRVLAAIRASEKQEATP